MGGMSDEVRGPSKIKTYLEYMELVEEYGDMFQDHNPNPGNKKLCKKLMGSGPRHRGMGLVLPPAYLSRLSVPRRKANTLTKLLR